MNLSDDISDSVSKLISNLGHFCEARGIDFIMLVQQGVSRWRSEMEAEGLHESLPPSSRSCPKVRSRKKSIL
jgi:hypothetical protein